MPFSQHIFPNPPNREIKNAVPETGNHAFITCLMPTFLSGLKDLYDDFGNCLVVKHLLHTEIYGSFKIYTYLPFIQKPSKTPQDPKSLHKTSFPTRVSACGTGNPFTEHAPSTAPALRTSWHSPGVPTLRWRRGSHCSSAPNNGKISWSTVKQLSIINYQW